MGLWRPILAYRPVSSPEHHRSLAVVPLIRYQRYDGGSWNQAYLRNARSSWYSNMVALDELSSIRDLNDWVKPGEPFCLVVFEKLPLNKENVELVLSQCRTTATEEVADEKPYSGVKLKLYVLMRNARTGIARPR